MTNLGDGLRFNLVGNPYPSPVDMVQFVDENEDAITGALYFWRKTNNVNSPSYCQWTAGTFVGNGEAQVFDPNDVIRTGQGFFVEAKPAQTQLVFNNTQRIDDNANQFFRPASADRHRIWLNLTNEAGYFAQTALVYVAGGNSEGLDAFDGRYINDGAIRFNSTIAGVEYGIQGRAPFVSTDVVPMSFTANASANYTIAIDHVDGLFLGDQQIYVKDNLLGVTHNLKTSAYVFAAEAGTSDSRFEIVYQNALSTNQPQLDANAVIVYKSNGVFVIDAGLVELDKVQAFDLQGRLIATKSDINTTQTTLDCGQTQQVLVLKIVGLDGQTVNKKVLN